jgi:hypothetical protein
MKELREKSVSVPLCPYPTWTDLGANPGRRSENFWVVMPCGLGFGVILSTYIIAVF